MTAGRQYSLFTPPPQCPQCHGTGSIRDFDGEPITCPNCAGTGVKPDRCITAGCDQDAVNGPWCPQHDPATAPLPF